MQIHAGIITISDRPSRGQYDDLGGPPLKKRRQPRLESRGGVARAG